MTNYGPAVWVPSSLRTVGSELGAVSVTSQEAFACKEQLLRVREVPLFLQGRLALDPFLSLP